MKKIVFTLALCLIMVTVSGQQKQGRVLYERIIQMQLRMMGPDHIENLMSRQHTDQQEVLFNDHLALRRSVRDERPEAGPDEEGGGMNINISGNNDATYSDLATGLITEQRELAGRNYVVADSIRKLNWKLTGDTSTIQGYPCQQAVAQRIVRRMAPLMENGQIRSREVDDTIQIIAWFTLAIPVQAGPEFQGQLPGLILGLDIDKGRMVYKAIEIADKTDLAAIRIPSKGKKITAAEFEKERAKLLKELESNNFRKGKTFGIGG